MGDLFEGTIPLKLKEAVHNDFCHFLHLQITWLLAGADLFLIPFYYAETMSHALHLTHEQTKQICSESAQRQTFI